MITIYTRTNKIWTKEYIAFFLNRILKRKRGPIAVMESLVRGLNELKYPYLINPPYRKATDIVHVLSGIQALKDCIELKKKGVIKTLTAGPNLTVVPQEENRLFYSKEIDKILLPSLWTKDLYISIDSYFKNKILIWPAGVRDPGEIERKNDQLSFIIYLKQCTESMKNTIIEEMKKLHLQYSIVKYGSHTQKEFTNLLEKHTAMIYVSNSESQGLALLEAWARNVPTLVWDRGYWTYKGLEWHNTGIGAPYLTKDCGLFFKDENDFKEKLQEFINTAEQFSPREYYLNNFTDKKIAENFIKLITEVSSSAH